MPKNSNELPIVQWPLFLLASKVCFNGLIIYSPLKLVIPLFINKKSSFFVRYLLQKILRWTVLSPKLPRMICGSKLLEMSICNMLLKKSFSAFAIF
jgi:hypothetical protein